MLYQRLAARFAFTCKAVLLRQCTYGLSFAPTLRFRSTEVNIFAANMTLCRQNYAAECESAINNQINLELYASYVYLSMAAHFDRDDVALKNFSEFFDKNSHEEREHAGKFVKYQNKRGGRIALGDIKTPEKLDWGTGLDAMQAALELEKTVNQALLDLHKVAGANGDPHLCDFLETEFLDEQVDAINELAKHITNLKRVGPGLGEYQFNKNSLS